MGDITLIVAVTDRAKSESFLDLHHQTGISLVLSVLGRGTATDAMLDYLGLESTEKAMLFSVTTKQMAKEVFKSAKRTMRLDSSGSGILMCIPVSSLGGGPFTKFLSEYVKTGECGNTMEPINKPMEKPMDKPMEKTDFELIIVIANEGYSELVMNAARSAKATGGTVVNAKGSVSEKAEKFFGVSIANKKDMIFIVTKTKNKSAIMKAIMNEAGSNSKAKSILFSVPVSNAAGLASFDEDSEDEEN